MGKKMAKESLFGMMGPYMKDSLRTIKLTVDLIFNILR
jgi:hypothetical protein